MSDKDAGIVLHPKQLVVAIRACIQPGRGEPLLIKGAPGIGKTDLVFTAADAEKHDVILSHPPVEDPTDSKGIPWYDPDEKRMRFMPVGQIAKALAVTKPTVWFIDDLGQASESVQKAYMQWVLAREVDGNKLSDYIKIIACTNRRKDRAGVSGILEPVKSRFTIVELETSVEDWSEWALDNGQPPEVIAYLRNVKADALHQFEATSDISNSPCPRNWAAVGRILQMGLTDTDVRFAMFAGRIGEAAATEFNSFLRIAEEAPSVDDILKDPKRAPIPENPDAMYAVASSLAHRATPKNIGAISVYLQRVHAAEKGEFCALTLRDLLRKDRAIKETPEFAALAKTPLAKDVFEAVASAK